MDCNRLLPDLVDERARNDPCGIFAKIPVGDSYPCTYRNVTNSLLATAVDHVVDLIVAKFGHSDNHECMAYMGLNDVRYTIVLLANIKAGFKTFFPSPRNSKEAQSSLFAELSCSKLMTTSPNPAGIPGADSMRTLIVPGLDDLLGLDPDVVVPKPYCKVFEDIKADPVFVLHTSGSTGIPKPLTYTNEFVSRLYHTQTLLPPKGYISVDERFRNGTYLITLPPFHIAGLAFTFLLPALFKSVPVYPTAGTPLTLEGFLCAMDSAQFDWAFLPPVVVDALGRDERALGIVAERLRYLFFTGGSVPRDTGKEVAKRIQLNQVLGSSECAAIPLIRSEHGLPEEDWHYVKIHPRANVEFEYRFDDPPNKCCELVQVRQQDETNDIRFQPVFCHFGDLNSYETKDLFVEHPTLDNYFTHVGRTDDIIVFLNGEKTNPVTFQSEVAKHPKVRSALLAGEQREEAVLIIEPFGEEERTEKLDRKLIDEVWPTVDDINGRSLKHAIVAKDRIIVARSSKPFLRTGKGTVQVRATLAMYKPDIDQLFREDLSETNTWSKYPTLQPPETVDVIDVVRRVARDSNQEVTSDATNFFSVGMDSLRALHMQRELGRIFPHVGMDPRVVYANPTIKSLAEAIMQASGPNEVTAQPRIDEVSDMIHHYKSRVDALCKEDIISWQGTTHTDASKTSRRNGTTSDLNKALLGLDSLGIATAIPPAEDAILLTGSTGALGSHILNLLLAAGSRKVFCLNRSVDSRAVQIRQNQSRRLPTDLPEHRVTFLTGDLTSPHFGLPLSMYETLQRSVTQVIHNAWPVDFNQPLQAFADCLDGVVNLVSFTYNSNLNVSLLFVSSIASVARYSEEGTIPEQNILDSGVPAAMGYGQSKYVAERVLAYASEALRIKTISVRVGQLCGDDWNIKEWFPSLITSSLHLKVLPKTLGAAADSSSLRWVPMDAAAKVLLDLSDVRGSTEPNITFNLLHPRPSQWSSFLPTVRRVLTEIALGRGEPQVELASYDEWVERLQKSGYGHIDDRSMTRNPALKLLPFFESLRFGGNFQRNYSIDQSLEHSANLRGLRQLEEHDLKAWIELWIFGAED